MSEQQCFLTGDTECELTEVLYDGSTYFINEDLADEHPLKKLRGMIADKIRKDIEEAERKEKEEAEKKAAALGQLEAAIETLGLPKEALANLLLGNGQASPATVAGEATATAETTTTATPNEEGFREVDGDLKSSIKASVNAEEGIAVGGSGYSNSMVKDEQGKIVREENKRIKKIDENTLVEKSNFGTTSIKMIHQDGSVLTKRLRDVDENYNLVRGSASGSGRAGGGQTRECPLCRGTGFTRTGQKSCPKCDATGFIEVYS